MALPYTSPQFWWFVGHVSTISFTFFQLLFLFFSLRYQLRFYRLALYGILLSYTIILQQTFKSRPTYPRCFASPAFIRLLLITNDNFHYWLFAIALLVLSTHRAPYVGPTPVAYAVVPYALLSLPHAATYLANNVLNQSPEHAALAQQLSAASSAYAEPLAVSAAAGEVSLVASLIFTAIKAVFMFVFRRWGFVAALQHWALFAAVVMFVRARYMASGHTKAAVYGIGLRIEGVLAHPSVPPSVHRAYATTKLVLAASVQPPAAKKQ